MSRTYVVTGANRGLGLEMARQLEAGGASVIATARHPESASDLTAVGVRVEPLDVGDPGSIAAFAARLADTPVDVLINNSGVGGAGQPIGSVAAEDLANLLRVNAVGPLLVTQALLPNLRAGRHRVVAAISSRMGSIDDNASGGYYAYRSSKAALNMLFRSLAVDLRSEGFTCTVLHPGWVRTDMGGPSAPLTARDSVAGLLRVIEGLTPEQSGAFLDHLGAPIPW